MIPIIITAVFILAASAQQNPQHAAVTPITPSITPSVTGNAGGSTTANFAASASLNAEAATLQSGHAPKITGTAAAALSSSYALEEARLDSAYQSANAARPNVDACGPKIPDPSVPDTCETLVDLVDAPAAYGVQCLNDTGSSAPINLTSCEILIPQLCANQWQSPGNWVWLTANGCSIGSFLPGPSFAGHTPWPSQEQCVQLIYAAMLETCYYNGYPYNIAVVNLRDLPSDGSPTDSGTAVNVGYGSYVVAGRQLRTKSDKKDCTWIPPDDFCSGPCYPPSYYKSKFQKPTPCAALDSPLPAVTLVPL